MWLENFALFILRCGELQLQYADKRSLGPLSISRIAAPRLLHHEKRHKPTNSTRSKKECIMKAPRVVLFLVMAAASGALALGASACGTDPSSKPLIVDEATARLAQVSLLTVSLEGGGVLPSACEPNYNPFAAPSAQTGNFTLCSGG